jgi:DNA primase
MMKDRIAIPIHDENGQLVAYCGRAVTQEQIEKEGKYKLPANFVKSAVVYHLHRQKDTRTLVLMESYLSVWWLYQAGIENAVALMGSKLSEEQEKLIVDTLGPKGQVILLFDADESGQAATKDCLTRLSRRLFVKTLDIRPHARKPHHLTPEQIKSLI